MAVHNLVDVGTVASRHRNCDWQGSVATGLQHEPISRRQTGHRQRKSPQSVAVIRIGSGEEDGKVRCEFIECCLQAVLQCGQVFVVTSAIGQADVEITDFLWLRVVSFAVNGECVDGRIIAHNGCGPVPLVNIAIDDQNLGNSLAGLQVSRCHDAVIKDAETFGPVAVGVMSSTCQIHRTPDFECGITCGDGGTTRST